jgi:hypothetical protein
MRRKVSLSSLHTLEVQHAAEWQRILRTGLRPHQKELAEWDQRTRLLRGFEVTVIPGLPQIAEYARARFAESIRRLKLPNDLNEVAQARIMRQEILYRPDKRFHFVLTEAALRFRLCLPDVMLGQLGRLVSSSGLPNVRLAIIGFETQYATSTRRSPATGRRRGRSSIASLTTLPPMHQKMASDFRCAISFMSLEALQFGGPPVRQQKTLKPEITRGIAAQ